MKARACSICEEPLRWWNAQFCMQCGQTICKRHACTIRRRSRSSVIFSFCTNCALQAAKRRASNPNSQTGALRVINPNSQTGALRNTGPLDSQAEVPRNTGPLDSQTGAPRNTGLLDSLLSSLSGISLAGFSFAGLKREQSQSKDQPELIESKQTKSSKDHLHLVESKQTEPSDPPSGEQEIPPEEQLQKDEETD